MRETNQKATIKGVVTNYKYFPNENGISKAFVTVADKVHNSRVQITLWDRKNGIPYGKKADGRIFNLQNMKMLFLNEDGSSKNTEIVAICNIGMYKDSPTFNVIAIMPLSNEGDHDMTFTLDGYITKVKGLDSEKPQSKVDIITYSYRDSDDNRSIAGHTIVTLTLPYDEYDLDNGQFVQIDGEILTEYQHDRFSRTQSTSSTKLNVVNAKIIEVDDDAELDLIKTVRNLEKGRKIVLADFLSDYE